MKNQQPASFAIPSSLPLAHKALVKVNIYHRIVSFCNQYAFLRSERLALSQPHFEDLVV